MSSYQKGSSKQSQLSKSASTSKSIHHGSKTNCCLCEKDHLVHSCPTFVKMNVQERVNTVKSKKLCFNCLRANHRVTDCKSKSRCRKCSKNRPSMIHMEKAAEAVTQKLSRKRFCNHQWVHTKKLKLADPGYCQRSNIVLLGADVVALISKEKVIKGPALTPLAQETE
ncbi:unnamed protein product [Allacma fusca]|uniref:Uncharacterized protein n=1 Tax=Allacma fusca TaxID=39272 RepID=A0A8J2L5F1_9HEXA|nr:unnamed protein product [Allacma fusca]